MMSKCPNRSSERPHCMFDEGGHIDFDDIMMEKNYDPTRSYCRSKLANILFTKELSQRLLGK